MKKILSLGLCLITVAALCSHFISTPPVFGNRMYAARMDNPDLVYLPAAQKAKKIKIALLLDTSNSMDGLIDQAKSQLWNIVNELSKAKVGNQSPDLEIALYQYGNDGLNFNDGYIRQETSFTHDLDLVSEKLFGLRTNGGSEFCGQVIHTSLNELEWGSDDADYKTIFIAGNESFNQGGISPEVAFNLAMRNNVFVNTIFCGATQAGMSSGWDATSEHAVGEFLNIDSDQKTVYVATPYDQQIKNLNSNLNETYIRYGTNGATARLNMSNQDDNAASYGESNYVNRVLTKNGSFYNNRNESWDLVDKMNTDPNFQVKDVDVKTLPEEMRKMDNAEQQQYIRNKQQERKNINREIDRLGKERANYLASQNTKMGETSLEGAMVKAIQQQAMKKGFSFENNIGAATEEPAFVPSLVDFDYYFELASEVKEYRKDRLVDFNSFLKMAKEPRTVILDTRSKEHYDAMHLKGAIHLNFSAFNIYDLARLIPDRNTRILIYCNNNIDTDSPEGLINLPSEEMKLNIQRAMVSKSATPARLGNSQVLKLDKNTYAGAKMDDSKTMALNIPTFINLYGYGYKNVYELNQLIQPNDPRLELEGLGILSGLK